MKRYDIAVAGGGPTGLATAIVAALAGCRVVVIEPKAGTIDKACGEGLMPGGVRILRELGVRGVDGHPFVGIRYGLVGPPDGPCATGTFRTGCGLGVRRTMLHDALRDRAEAVGVEPMRASVRAVEQRAESVRIDTTNGEVVARWMVGADGLHSPVRRMLGLEIPQRGPRRYGVRRHFAIAPWSDRVEVTFAPGAEAYVTPVAGNVVGVAFLYEPPGTFDDLVARFPALAARLRGAEALTSSRGAGPFLQHVRARRRGHVLLAGDAAGYVDPLTGEGVSLGMATGALAATCIARGEIDAYEARWRALTRGYRVLTRALVAVARRHWLHRPLVHAAAAIPSAFDRALGLLDVGDVVCCADDRPGAAPFHRERHPA